MRPGRGGVVDTALSRAVALDVALDEHHRSESRQPRHRGHLTARGDCTGDTHTGGHLPRLHRDGIVRGDGPPCDGGRTDDIHPYSSLFERSEEHTSELQSRGHLVCRLLLETTKSLCNN